MSIRLAVNGAGGRMGRRIVALCAEDDRFSLVAALDAPGGSTLGRDAGELAGIGRLGVALSDRPSVSFDVLVDFSAATALPAVLALCTEAARPLVIGTTGHAETSREAMRSAARRIAVLHAANMSLGVNVLLGVVERLAAALGDDVDVEIIESHHRFKADAPSGTALALRDAVLRGRGAADGDVVYGRHGLGPPRPRGQIGVHAVRGGDVVGEHEVRFVAMGETVSVRHAAHTRDTFARGALAAAAWIVGRPPGLYSMQDVLSRSPPA